MGICRSYRPRKRKFHGNQNKSTGTASSNEIMTASSLKLQQCNEVSNELAFRQQEKKTPQCCQKSIHGTVNCGVSVDGTWQRRGFSSLNGCVSAISVDTGKIIDFETLSQFCRKCNSKTEQQNV
ncbi:hypothetical protein TNCV_1540271 [Trichonephila clavipes]|nr:hypothetical protein TNCV_1540271 [Trichonephila clavipes]